MRLPVSLSELRLDLLALLWPTACVHCGAPDRDCCLACRVEVRRPRPLVRAEIGGVALARDVYDGALRAMLVAFKHDGRTGFRRELGEQLRLPLLTALELRTGEAAPVLVTVPSRPTSVRRRGYRHVDALLGAALHGQRLRVLRIRALKAQRGRRSQVGLSATERVLNARRIAVRASALRALQGREVIVVDDVITTGATVSAAREALEQAGARVIAVVALCHAVRRDTREFSERSLRVATVT